MPYQGTKYGAKSKWNWKTHCFKVVETFPLKKLGNIDCEEDNIMVKAKKFVAMCYGIKGSTDMLEMKLVLVEPIKRRVS